MDQRIQYVVQYSQYVLKLSFATVDYKGLVAILDQQLNQHNREQLGSGTVVRSDVRRISGMRLVRWVRSFGGLSKGRKVGSAGES